MYTLLRIFVYRSPPGHERETSWLTMSKSKRCHVLLPDLLCSRTKESAFGVAFVLVANLPQDGAYLSDMTILCTLYPQEPVEAIGLGLAFTFEPANPLQCEMNFQGLCDFEEQVCCYNRLTCGGSKTKTKVIKQADRN